MVLKRNLDDGGTTGFHVPVIPRAPRSARSRGLQEKIIDNNQICAIELLASLAGKLLQESNSSSASSSACKDNKSNLIVGKCVVKCESNELLKVDPFDPLSAEEIVCVPERVSEKGETRGIDDVKPITHHEKNDEQPLDIDYKREMKGAALVEEKGRLGNRHIMKNSAECRSNFPVPMMLDSKPRFDTKLGHRDYDRSYPHYSRLSNKFKTYRHPQNIKDHRTRKSLTSKQWKAASKLMDHEPIKTNGEMHPFFRKRKVGFNHEASLRDLLCKRRKLFDQGSIITSDGVYSSQSIMHLQKNGVKDENGVSSSILSRQNSLRTEDSHVKFSIKSFKIPELLIEVQQSATVGSLKRTVMEAVTAILGGGLRVGVVLEGKKIRDDNRTLLQSGISSKDSNDTLGFTLEPSPVVVPRIAAPEQDAPLLSPNDGPLLLTRSPDDSILDPVMPDALSDTSALMDLGKNAESGSLTSYNLTEKTIPESRALVRLPPVSPRPLSAVPMNQKVRRTDMAQRRIRRPFSIPEVEALVHAVEELGTGRWRDVKLRAFESAGHRTYVDLKDKWKTLVHTASISPQQRRGEPVPQELLDRVLAAHAYWSQCQSKQIGKNKLLN